MPKRQLYLVELEDNASIAKAYDHIRNTPGLSAAVDGIRIAIPTEPTVFGTESELYGAKLLMKAAVQRDLMHTILKRRGVGILQDGELQKIGEIADKLVEEHPEMWAIRVSYEEECAAKGISLNGN